MPHPKAPPLKRKYKRPAVRLSISAPIKVKPYRDETPWEGMARESAKADKRYAELKARRHGSMVETRYRLPKGAYAAMMARQDNACVTCNRHESDFAKRLHVDHNHQTGKVRGLLCNGCNMALGAVRENPQTLRHLAAYLEYHASKE